LGARGSGVAISYANGEIAIWDVSKSGEGKLPKRLKLPDRDGWNSRVLAYSPKGEYVAAADGRYLIGADKPGGQVTPEVLLFAVAGKDLSGVRLFTPPRKDKKDVLPETSDFDIVTKASIHHQIVFSPEGKKVALHCTGASSEAVFFFNARDNQQKPQQVMVNVNKKVEGSKTALIALGFLGETEAYMLNGDGGLTIYKVFNSGMVNTNAVKQLIVRDLGAQPLAATTPDGRALVTVQLFPQKGDTLQVVWWDLANDEAKAVKRTPLLEPAVASPLVALAPDASFYAVTAGNNTIEIYQGLAAVSKSGSSGK
jgi:hypothetical protein